MWRCIIYVTLYGDIWQRDLRATRKSFILGLSEKGRLRNILQLPTSALSTFSFFWKKSPYVGKRKNLTQCLSFCQEGNFDKNIKHLSKIWLLLDCQPSDVHIYIGPFLADFFRSFFCNMFPRTQENVHRPHLSTQKVPIMDNFDLDAL